MYLPYPPYALFNDNEENDKLEVENEVPPDEYLAFSSL